MERMARSWLASSAGSSRPVARTTWMPFAARSRSRLSILVERLRGLVDGPAVELEHEARVWPEEVDLVAVHPGVDAGLVEAVLVAGGPYEAFSAAAGEGLDVAVVRQDPLELVAALPSRQAFEDSLDRFEVEQLSQLGLIDRVGQPLFAEDVGEVDDGASEAGDGDVVDEGSVFGVDASRAVQREALLRLASAGRGDLDPSRPSLHAPHPPGGAVTSERLWPAGVNSSNEVGLVRQGGVAYRVDALVLRHEPARLDATFDLPRGQSRLPHLLPFRDPMLPARQGLHHVVRRVWALLCTVWVVLRAHTPSVRQRWRPMCDVCDD